MDYFVHELACCESKKIGKNTRIWAFTHILEGANIGNDCNICDHVFIENDVIIGNRVTIKSGVQLWDGIRIADNVFVGPNATFTNDRFPRSKIRPEKFLNTFISTGASIGANATILPNLTIGKNAMVGAGAVVIRSVPDNAIVVGNPARIVGYVDALKVSIEDNISQKELVELGIEGVKIYKLPYIKDLRGDLLVAEASKELPFIPKRCFVIINVPGNNVRGEHAHIACEQFLVCLKGACSIILDDSKNKKELRLEKPDIGIYVPPMTWLIQYQHTIDCVLLVLASHPYDPKDYIRQYDNFLKLKRTF